MVGSSRLQLASPRALSSLRAGEGRRIMKSIDLCSLVIRFGPGIGDLFCSQVGMDNHHGGAFADQKAELAGCCAFRGLQVLDSFIKNDVYKRIVAFKPARDCSPGEWGPFPWNDPPSRPPLNLTMMRWSMYLSRSKMLSFRACCAHEHGVSTLPPSLPSPFLRSSIKLIHSLIKMFQHWTSPSEISQFGGEKSAPKSKKMKSGQKLILKRWRSSGHSSQTRVLEPSWLVDFLFGLR